MFYYYTKARLERESFGLSQIYAQVSYTINRLFAHIIIHPFTIKSAKQASPKLYSELFYLILARSFSILFNDQNILVVIPNYIWAWEFLAGVGGTTL